MSQVARKSKRKHNKGESHIIKAKLRLSAKTTNTAASSGVFTKNYGRLVWGKILGSRTWPGVIVNHHECGMRPPLAERVWVFWFGDNRVSQVPLGNVMHFKVNFKVYFTLTNNPTFERGVIDCIKELKHQSKLPQDESKEDLIQWAHDGFPGAVEDDNLAGHAPSARVEKILNRIKKIQLMGHSCSSSDSFFPVSSSSSPDSDSSNADERRNWKPKASLLKSARNMEYDIEKLCIACSRTDCEIKGPHPYFVGGVCEHCKTAVEENIEDLEAGIDMQCVVCASPGKMVLCDSPECERVYCTGCIELLVTPSAVSLIEKTNPWYCFLCEPFSPSTHGLLRPRLEWREKISVKCSSSWTSKFEEDNTPDPSTFPKRPLRVLSVFDGIGTGLVALDRLCLEVGVYYCSEVDEAAMNVVNLNFGTRVKFLGTVQKLTRKEVEKICPIDLLIGGSPCSDLSFVNPKRKGLFDCSGSGYLFFYFFKILKNIKFFNKDTHLFWMFENVKNMPRFMKAQISLFLQKQPIVIDATNFSPQSRPRCFWGNIPGMYKPISPLHNCHHKLSQYINKVSDRRAVVRKINCITTNPLSLRLGAGNEWPVQMNGHGDIPWITEIEKIFGFPTHYTDTGNLSLRERQILLGRAWSVPVICYIFEPLCEYFPHKNKTSDVMAVNTVLRKSEEFEIPVSKETLNHEKKKVDISVKTGGHNFDKIILQQACNEPQVTRDSLAPRGQADVKILPQTEIARDGSIQKVSDEVNMKDLAQTGSDAGEVKTLVEQEK